MPINLQVNRRVAMFSIHSDPLACLGSQQAGGQNIYVRSLAKELGKLGWKVDIFTRWDTPHKKQIAHIDKNCRVIRLKGGEIGYLPREKLIEILPEIYQGFLKFINYKNFYDLFHGHYWDGGWVAKEAQLQFKKPLIVNFHSLGMIKQETKKRLLKKQNEYEYFVKRLNIENEIIKNSSVIISLAESEKEDLIKLYGCNPEKCAVVPGGVDLKQWGEIEKSKARELIKMNNKNFVLLYVGRLEWRKGIGTLIAATSLLKKEILKLKVLIIGGQIFGKEKNPDDVKEYERLKSTAKKEELDDIVRFVGRVQHSGLPIFYSAADIFVIPSYYEPFGLVTLEAMASKVPVVASNVGGLAKIIENGKTGLLFEPRNPVALKEKILSIYNSKDLKENLISAAYKKVQGYSWGNMVIKVNEIYNKLIC